MQPSKLRAYFQLTKPGVTLGNVLTVVAGYFLAAAGNVSIANLVSVTIGMTFVIAGACALNNFLDKDIDSHMTRTKKRPSVMGILTSTEMVVFALVITMLGLVMLYALNNMLTAVIALIGFITYVWLYGALAKRRSVHGTIVGSISGAMPIAAGYAAASGYIDAGMVAAFLILYLWQFPEFYSIAIYRRKEYAQAKVPIISVVKGVQTTMRWIGIYTILYVLATLALTPLGYKGELYFIVMLIAGLYWLWVAAKGYHTTNAETWARSMFKTSMYMILLLCVMLSIGPILP